MKKILIGAGLAAALVGGFAVAQTAMGPGGPPHGMKWADANEDGVITRAEAANAATSHFDKIDANKDGKVTRDEMIAAREAHRGAMRAHFGDRGDGPRGHRGRHHGGPDGPGGPGGMLAHLDTDRDGKISRAEFDTPFERMDTNRDGFVDGTERQAMMQALRAEFGRNGDRWNGKAPPAPPAHTLPPASSPTSSSPSTNTGK